jgi:mono/diheme cytochrome c family protein
MVVRWSGRKTEMAGCRYMSGGTALRVSSLAVIVAAGLLLGTLAASPARADDAKAVYTAKCASCHGATGKGDGPAGKFLKPPPADFATVLKGVADADIAKIIKEGGKAVGKSATMPAFGSILTAEDINGIVEYVKGMASAK